MRRWRYSILTTFVVLVALILSAPARAQVEDEKIPVALVADSVAFDVDTGIVTASGSVEVYYGARTLTADKITYNSQTERLSAEGDIVLRDKTGTTLYADMAELDGELRDGIVQGAMTVLEGGGRIAAVEGRRYDDRYNALSKAVFSNCRVCEEDPTPLWRIRARRIIHDEESRDIFYEDATLDVMGVSVLYLPYFRHPDPTVKRRSGLLVPEFRSSTTFGNAIKVPYHYVIDDHRDATITPFITTKSGLLLEGEYRAVTESGGYNLRGSVTYNDLEGGNQFRGHLFGDGRFDVFNGYQAGFDVAIASDDPYLRRYEFSNDDRLTSRGYLEKFTPRGFTEVNALYFQSLRDGEPAGQVPLVFPEIAAERIWDDPFFGGAFTGTLDSFYLTRNEGRDVARLSVGGEWETERTLDNGVILGAFASARGDLYRVFDDNAISDDLTTRFTGQAGVEIRYPLIRHSEGLTQIIEPIAQFTFAPYGQNDPDIPNEDSLNVEFDETNIFARSRFPGLDLVEEGPRVNVGLRYELMHDSGFGLDAAVGQVFRFRDSRSFTSRTGLRDQLSDTVAAVSARFPPWFSATGRIQFDDDLQARRTELYGDASLWRLDLKGSYAFLTADPSAGTTTSREEAFLATELEITDNWSLLGDWRRDLANGENVEIGGGIRYRNECVEVDFSASRRFTSSIGAPASTDFGLTVRLFALGGDRPVDEYGTCSLKSSL